MSKALYIIRTKNGDFVTRTGSETEKLQEAKLFTSRREAVKTAYAGDGEKVTPLSTIIKDMLK